MSVDKFGRHLNPQRNRLSTFFRKDSESESLLGADEKKSKPTFSPSLIGNTGNFTFQGKRLTNIGAPVDDVDAVTKAYVDASWKNVAGDYTFQGKRLTDVGDAVDDKDAVSQSFVKNTCVSFDEWGVLSAKDRVIRNVGLPKKPSDAATKFYVDVKIDELKKYLAKRS